MCGARGPEKALAPADGDVVGRHLIDLCVLTDAAEQTDEVAQQQLVAERQVENKAERTRVKIR